MDTEMKVLFTLLIGLIETIFGACLFKYHTHKKEYDRRYWGKNSLKPVNQEIVVKMVFLFFFWIAIMFTETA